MVTGGTIYRMFKLLDASLEESYPHAIWRSLADEILAAYMRTAVAAERYVCFKVAV